MENCPSGDHPTGQDLAKRALETLKNASGPAGPLNSREL